MDQDLETDEGEKTNDEKGESSESKPPTTVGLKENLANSGKEEKKDGAPSAAGEKKAEEKKEPKTEEEKKKDAENLKKDLMKTMFEDD